jgi:hypothetical protein
MPSLNLEIIGRFEGLESVSELDLDCWMTAFNLLDLFQLV